MTATIAITIGDPAGVGPEIALKAAHHFAAVLETGTVRLRLIGSLAALGGTARSLALPLPAVANADEPLGIWPIEGSAVEIGQVSAEGGRQAYEAVAEGVRRTMAGEASAIVTAPLNKESLHLAGYRFPGHTELLAALTGARDSAMMLAHGSFRVSHVTTHIPLEDVPKRATEPRMRRVLDLTIEALNHLGITAPRVAIAALNPHAGEGG
ncbi:4-hydroxythreonine-4-phosphate dehydrogenase PdxA, partial [Mesorhizobium sp. M7A.F.Ca.CA.004.12.1.1]